MASLYSKKLERHVLAGVIGNPESFPDVDQTISCKDFYFKIHETIYKLARNKLIKGEQVDIFTGHEAVTRLWNKLVPSNQGVTVVLENPRCARAGRQ